jgi:hypothetical protein
MTTHRDIPDEVVKRARDYDVAHYRADQAVNGRTSWGSVPADQVRRLLWGAYGDLAVTVMHGDGSEEKLRGAESLFPSARFQGM